MNKNKNKNKNTFTFTQGLVTINSSEVCSEEFPSVSEEILLLKRKNLLDLDRNFFLSKILNWLNEKRNQPTK